MSWKRLCALEFGQLLGLVVSLTEAVIADASVQVRHALAPARALLRRASWGEAFSAPRVYAEVLEPACRGAIWARTPAERQICRLVESCGRSLLRQADPRLSRRVQWQVMLTLASLDPARLLHLDLCDLQENRAS